MIRQAAVVLGAGLLAACTAAAAPEVPAPHPSAARHPTIVSLNPCADAVLAEVTAPGQLRAISSYSHDPRASSMDPAIAQRFPAVGGTAEEVLALHPDVVVAGAFNPVASVRAFEALGLRVETVGSVNDLAAARAQVRQLARLAGEPGRGEALIARIDAALAAAAPPTGARPIPTLLWEPGGIVAGENTLVSDLMRRAGFASMAAARGLGQGQHLPLEALIADPPALLLASGDPRANEDRLLRHPALAAVPDMRRADFDPRLTFCGGPTIPRVLDRLRTVRHTVAGT